MARPVKDRITRDRASRAALELIDEIGLDAFTVPKLAKRLSVTTPALYHHFADRSTLLSGVAEAILEEADRPPRPDDAAQWRDWLLASSLNLRTAVLRHRRAAPVLLQFPPRLYVGQWFDSAAQVLSEAGVPWATVIPVLDGIEVLSMGAILTEATRDRGPAGPVFAGGESMPFLDRALAANRLDDVELYTTRISSFLDGIVPRSP